MSAQISETDEQAIEREAAESHVLQVRLLGAVQRGRDAIWEVAECLYEIRDRAGWLALGYETRGEWLADPALGISRSTFDRLAQLWEVMVVQRQVPMETLARLDRTKVAVVLPALQAGKVKEEEALADVEALGWRDLREKYVPKSAPDEGNAAITESAPADAGNEPDDESGERVEPAVDTASATDRARARLEEAERDITGALDSGAENPRLASATLKVCRVLIADALNRCDAADAAEGSGDAE